MEPMLLAQKPRSLINRKFAFTLVEVIVVTALILLISLVGIQTADVVSQREKEERLRYSLLEMRAAMDLYFQEHLKFPDSISKLTDTVRNSGRGFYLRRFPINPIVGNSAEPFVWEIASSTKRSYASIAEENAHWKRITTSTTTLSPVAPILDIRCPDPGYTALDGTMYSKW